MDEALMTLRHLLTLTLALPLLAAAADPLRIGLIAPLSGGSADFGTSMQRGAQLAVEEINAVGGYLGRPLELVVRDDRANPDAGRAAAEDLVEKQRVDFTLGFCNTGVALKALEVFERNRHLLMVPCSQGTAVTAQTPPARSYVFRLAPRDDMNAAALVREMVDRRGLRKVAILADRTGYGEGGLRDLSRELDKRGLKPAFVGRFELGVKDLADVLTEAREAGTQAVVNYTVGPEQAVAVRSRATLNWRVPYYAPWPLSFASVLKAAGAEALEGTLMLQSIIQDGGHERRSAFIARYTRAHPDEKPIGSLMAAAQAYDALHLMLRALFQSRDPGGPALKAALENLNAPYRGVVSTFDRPFDTNDHDAFSERMIWMGVWRRGNIVFNDPAEAKLSAMIRRKRE
jgi:branched-chain amino acid transport system substrate-binding protein